MNILPSENQTQIFSALVEGNSIRAAARMVDVVRPMRTRELRDQKATASAYAPAD